MNTENFGMTLRQGWSQIEKAVNDLGLMITNYDTKCDVVLAISPDLIPGTLMASALNLPLVPILYGNIMAENYPAVRFPRISNHIASGTGQLPETPSLLLITSMLDGEAHVNEVVKEYQKRGHDVQLVTLFHCSCIEAVETKLYWQFIQGGQKSVKLTFPW